MTLLEGVETLFNSCCLFLYKTLAGFNKVLEKVSTVPQIPLAGLRLWGPQEGEGKDGMQRR